MQKMTNQINKIFIYDNSTIFQWWEKRRFAFNVINLIFVVLLFILIKFFISSYANFFLLLLIFYYLIAINVLFLFLGASLHLLVKNNFLISENIVKYLKYTILFLLSISTLLFFYLIFYHKQHT